VSPERVIGGNDDFSANRVARCVTTVRTTDGSAIMRERVPSVIGEGNRRDLLGSPVNTARFTDWVHVGSMTAWRCDLGRGDSEVAHRSASHPRCSES
jgi:hypothetical protein